MSIVCVCVFARCSESVHNIHTNTLHIFTHSYNFQLFIWWFVSVNIRLKWHAPLSNALFIIFFLFFLFLQFDFPNSGVDFNVILYVDMCVDVCLFLFDDWWQFCIYGNPALYISLSFGWFGCLLYIFFVSLPQFSITLFKLLLLLPPFFILKMKSIFALNWD